VAEAKKTPEEKRPEAAQTGAIRKKASGDEICMRRTRTYECLRAMAVVLFHTVCPVRYYGMEKARQEMMNRGISDYILEPLGEGKHIFSHVEWHMTGYRIRLQAMTKQFRQILDEDADWALVTGRELEESYALPSAFDRFKKQIDNS
jgi:adenine-specific DNA glycosylase